VKDCIEMFLYCINSTAVMYIKNIAKTTHFSSTLALRKRNYYFIALTKRLK